MAHDQKAGGGGPTYKECIPFLDTTPNQLFARSAMEQSFTFYYPIPQQICRLISSLSGEDGSLFLNLNTVDGIDYICVDLAFQVYSRKPQIICIYYPDSSKNKQVDLMLLDDLSTKLSYTRLLQGSILHHILALVQFPSKFQNFTRFPITSNL